MKSNLYIKNMELDLKPRHPNDNYHMQGCREAGRLMQEILL